MKTIYHEHPAIAQPGAYNPKERISFVILSPRYFALDSTIKNQRPLLTPGRPCTKAGLSQVAYPHSSRWSPELWTSTRVALA
jgi:hypothetical protein